MITATLVETFELDARQLTPQSTFEDIGLDSLALVELALVVHERTGTEVEGITAQSTLAEAAALLASATDGTAATADAAAAADGAPPRPPRPARPLNRATRRHRVDEPA
nr:acyl carrier protein [Streptomyces sp. SID4948]